MHTQINTQNTAGARPASKQPVSCEILVRETFVNAYDQVRGSIILLDAAKSLIDLSGGVVGGLAGTDGDDLTRQIVVLIDNAQGLLMPVRTALGHGELGEIGGAA